MYFFNRQNRWNTARKLTCHHVYYCHRPFSQWPTTSWTTSEAFQCSKLRSSGDHAPARSITHQPIRNRYAAAQLSTESLLHDSSNHTKETTLLRSRHSSSATGKAASVKTRHFNVGRTSQYSHCANGLPMDEFESVGTDKSPEKGHASQDLREGIDVLRYGEQDWPHGIDHQHQFHSGFQSAFETNSISDEEKPEQAYPKLGPTRRKIDLSYESVRRLESASATESFSTLPPSTPTAFRDNAGLRRILGRYIQHIDPLLDKSMLWNEPDSQLDQHLPSVFDAPTRAYLAARGYDIQDVVSWSWILDASSMNRSIRRHTLLARLCRKSNLQRMPLFLTLQLLRGSHINSANLNILLDEIETDLASGNRWSYESGAVLLIRLLRHARMADLSCYARIVDLVPHVLKMKTNITSSTDIQRLSHFCNRFLSLLALPLAKNPFLSVPTQQQAQLKIARLMMESKIQLFLNREGYRALARLQLMHSKTVEEQQWSSVKGSSWPPWRHDQLGIDASIDYPGRESRVSKVIKRLLEAGYGPESLEQEAQILAGWDTDKSPTVQTRRVVSSRPLSWLKRLWKTSSSSPQQVDHYVWAARVSATRSVREAWVCFHSYMNTTADSSRQLRVYLEMFNKLFARTQQTEQKSTPSPGDGKEVFPNPISPRDLVYVPEEPLTIDELYSQMLQDGVRPAGRLLAHLIEHALTSRQGFEYIEQSTLNEVKKDVLLHPEKYPRYFIQNVFSTLPQYLLASYVALLARGHTGGEAELYWPGSRSAEENGKLPLSPTKPLHSAVALVHIWKPTYLPAYHAVLEGLCTQAKARRLTSDSSSTRQHSYHELIKIAKDLIDLLEEEGQVVDLICFRKIVVLFRNMTIRAPAQVFSQPEPEVEPVALIKSIFSKALWGHRARDGLLPKGQFLPLGQQPYWKDVEALLLILGFGRDHTAVLEVLSWIRSERECLQCVGDGGYKMQRLACAARVAMEAKWLSDDNNAECATTEQLSLAKEYMNEWSWPDQIDLEEFRKHHSVWFEGMRAAVKHASSRL